MEIRGHTDAARCGVGHATIDPTDSVRLADDNVQRMIASIWSVLDGSESPTVGAKGVGARAEGAEPGQEESAATRSVTHPLVTTESPAEKWQIGLDKAQAMLRATTQTGLWTVINPFARRYMMRLQHLWYPVVKKTLYLDMMFAWKTKSLRQHTCAQVFTDGVGFTYTYPVKKKSEAGDRLEKLFRTLQTIPEAIVTGGASKKIICLARLEAGLLESDHQMIMPPSATRSQSIQSTYNHLRPTLLPLAKLQTCNRVHLLLSGCIQVGIVDISKQNLQVILISRG
jgi:hypothetical protein